MSEIRGRTAIVTGASRGLGKVISMELARQGANLVLAARSQELLEEVASEVRKLGVRAIIVPTDVSNDSGLQQLVDAALAEFKAIDILINNAGIEAFEAYHLIEPAHIVETIQVNLTATLLLTRYVLPHMLKAGRGHIVNMASIAGKMGPAFGAAYGASKAGMIAFTQALRSELHGTGVSVSAICPGFANDGGIYEVIKARTGRGTPWYLGSTTANAVARAVVKSIRNNRPEMIVNFPALRPVFTINAAIPRLGEWIARITTRRYLKKAAARD